MAEYSKKATKLLRTLIDVVALRNDDKKAKKYQSHFRGSDTFLVAKIKGEVEFIPSSILPEHLKKRKPKVQELLVEVFGDPSTNDTLDERLSDFYRKHNLKRDIESISSTVRYYLKPKPLTAPAEEETPKAALDSPPFFTAKAIEKCSPYANQGYLASDPNLQKVGAKFGSKIVNPTNYWLRALDLSGFELEPERYWQVAGLFKSFTWGKLYKPENKDKRVFFSIGVDVVNGALFYNLDCQRTGSNKLGRDLILRFDHFLGGGVGSRIKLKKLGDYDWKSLISETKEFIKKNERLYDQAVDYLWNDQVNTKNFKNTLIEVRSVEAIGNGENGKSNGKIFKKISLLALGFEKKMLTLMGKNDLAKKVRLMPNKKFDLLSYTMEGAEKWIKLKTSTNSSPHPISVSKKDIEESKDPEKTVYLYCVFDYVKSRNAGKLLIRKGDFSRFLRLRPTTYEASFKR